MSKFGITVYLLYNLFGNILVINAQGSCPYMSPFRFRCDPSSPFASFDGSCNNLNSPWLGQASSIYKRYMQPAYSDGRESPRDFGVNGNRLPNPRVISRTIGNDNNLLNPQLTHITALLGQFIAHDLTGQSTTNANCPCFNNNPFDCMSVQMPLNEDIMRMSCLKFSRSSSSNQFLGCSFDRREQFNVLTHFLDLSPVYGSSQSTSNSVRSFFRGGLRSSQGVSGRQNLPMSNGQFFAGEGRLNVNMALVGIHTLFLREHNRIATGLSSVNPNWSDERLYMETRRILQAIYQHITYNEYLPATVGMSLAISHGLLAQPANRYFEGYDPNVDPSMSNEFAGAAFRFGHSLIRNQINRFDSNGNRIGIPINMSRIILNNAEAFNSFFGGLDSIIVGLANEPAARFDANIADTLQNHLFEFRQSDGSIEAVDLIAVNILRGRDHGLPSYTRVRELCGLGSVTDFNDLINVIPLDTLNRLRSLYNNVNDIDLYVGGLSEFPIASVGPTFACIIARQFRDTKIGDRFYYENSPSKSSGAFTIEQLNEIRKTSLASLMCNNLDLSSIQRNAFNLPNSNNPRVSCSFFQSIDFTKWRPENNVTSTSSTSSTSTTPSTSSSTNRSTTRSCLNLIGDFACNTISSRGLCVFGVTIHSKSVFEQCCISCSNAKK